jgi:hypothetical protein
MLVRSNDTRLHRTDTITGVTDLGVECRGIDFFSFLAGNELPATFPSLAPTTSLRHPGPTPNPLRSCELAGYRLQTFETGRRTDLGPPLRHPLRW